MDAVISLRAGRAVAGHDGRLIDAAVRVGARRGSARAAAALGAGLTGLLWSAAVFGQDGAPGSPVVRAQERADATATLVTDAEVLRGLATQYLGRPYAMGAEGDSAFDCSGFVRRVYAEAGYALPRVSRDQARVGTPVSLDALALGDLVFFAGDGTTISHVGIYLGDDEIIHAASGQGAVTISDLSSGWYRRHIVSARRILGGDARPRLDGGDAELAEHGGRFRLLATLRRPARRPEPNYGPVLAGARETGLRLRAAMLTEVGVAGFTLVPEATFVYDNWGLELVAAFVVRFPLDGAPTIGRFAAFKDYLRFVRTVRLGLPGADLEIALSRLDDLTLGSGAIVDHVVPGMTVAGIPGFTVAHAPLATTANVAFDGGFLRGVLDDAFDPRFLGLGGGLSWGPLTVGLSAATDQSGRARIRTMPDEPPVEERRAINGFEAYARIDVVDGRRWSLDVSGQGWLLTALSEAGVGAEVSLRGQYRFGRTDSLSVDLRGGRLGTRSLRGLFGPTYLVHRARHTDALAAAEGRTSLGGEVRVELGKWRCAVAYDDAVGSRTQSLDRALSAMVSVEGLSLGATRWLDVRALYVGRAIGNRDAVDVAQVGLRLRFNRWLSSESYFQLGTRGEGGVGAVVQWTL